MILLAALLVLLGLGLFVGGILTGVTALYWACVGACVVAAVLLVASRRGTDRGPAEEPVATPERTGPEKTRPEETTPDRTTQQKPRTAEQPVAPPAASGAHAEPLAAAPGEHDDPPTVVEESGGGLHAAAHRAPPSATTAGSPHAAHRSEPEEPGVEEVEVTDLLLVVDLKDEVLVVDEHPRYHLEGCRFLTGRETIPLPLDEARTDGFTPCSRCTPDRHLADRERARRAAKGR